MRVFVPSKYRSYMMFVWTPVYEPNYRSIVTTIYATPPYVSVRYLSIHFLMLHASINTTYDSNNNM